MKIPRRAESAHWYHKDGTPCHEVTAKTTGLPRPTTVADDSTGPRSARLAEYATARGRGKATAGGYFKTTDQ